MKLDVNLNVFISKRARREVRQASSYIIQSRQLRNNENIKCTGYYPYQKYKVTNIVMVRRNYFFFLFQKLLGKLVECCEFTLHLAFAPHPRTQASMKPCRELEMDSRSQEVYSGHVPAKSLRTLKGRILLENDHLTTLSVDSPVECSVELS